MRKRAWRFVQAISLLGEVLAIGCASAYVVPVAGRTPSVCGKITLYGTDNVPFEYEELGTIGLGYNPGPSASTDACLRVFISEAEKLGAEAVLNFRVEPVMNWLGDWSQMTMTGVAVKIKRN